MLSPRNIIYGFCRFTNPPKPKYLISLYRSSDLNIIACFTTSQTRALKNAKGEVVSYVFEIGGEIGLKPDGSPFSFPHPTVIPFDYCFQNKSQEELLKGFESPAIICILHQQEYLNLIYAMYKSKATPQKYKGVFAKILEEQCP